MATVPVIAHPGQPKYSSCFRSSRCSVWGRKRASAGRSAARRRLSARVAGLLQDRCWIDDLAAQDTGTRARVATESEPPKRVLRSGSWRCGTANASSVSTSSKQRGLEEILENARAASGISSLEPGSAVKLTGKQELMEMEGEWEFTFTADGRFAEAYVGADLACLAGFDGEATAWEVDACGRVLKLDMDDYEVSLLVSWLKTGYWASPHAAAKLCIRSLLQSDAEYADYVGFRQSMLPSSDTKEDSVLAVSLLGCKAVTYVALDSETWLPRSAIIRGYGTTAVASWEQWEPVSPRLRLLVPRLCSIERASGDRTVHTVSYAELALLPLDHTQLQGPAPPASAELAPAALLPLDHTQADPHSDLDADGAAVGPTENTLAHAHSSAGRHQLVESTEHTLALASIFPRASLFAVPQPHAVTMPAAAHSIASLDFSDPAACVIEAVQTPTGHLLVLPQINDKNVGYFILDTGASTFTMEPALADRLALRSFGCVRTVTVTGPAKCSFREASSFSLGPIRIIKPRFVDVPGAGLAQAGLPVAGICGFDVFHHCRVHLRRIKGRGRVLLTLSDPDSPFDEASVVGPGKALIWLPVRMLSSTPQVELRFCKDSQGEMLQGSFLLDTGAAGSNIIFSSSATKQLGLWPQKDSRGRGAGRVRGLGGGSEGEMKVAEVVLPRVALVGSEGESVEAEGVRTIVMEPDAQGLELSVYGAGLICQNFLSPFDLLFDYSRQRVGIIAPKEKCSGYNKARGG